jgi:hypothetical protein
MRVVAGNVLPQCPVMRGRSADPDNGDLLQAKIWHFGAADLADELRDEEGSAHASPLLIPIGLALCILHEIDWRTVDFHIFHTSCMQVRGIYRQIAADGQSRRCTQL